MKFLFSGIGGPTPLGLAQSVKMIWPDARCIGVDASAWAPSMYRSEIFERTYRVPSASDESYWDVMDSIIRREQVDFAFIVPETETLVWARRAADGSLPCKAHLPNAKLAEFCFDKLQVAQALHPLGLTPETVTIEAHSALDNDTEILDYPYWVRIRSGAGALGALKIESRKDLLTWLSLHAGKVDFIASEFLPGRNYACKMLYFEGKLVQSSSAERIDYLLSAAAPSGISGMCARGRLLNRPDLVDSSRLALEKISERLQVPLHGMFTVDFKEDSEGSPLITEINIRHVSFTEAFSLGGVNFAATTVKLYFENDLSWEAPNSFSSEDFFIRGVDAPLRLVREDEIRPLTGAGG